MNYLKVDNLVAFSAFAMLCSHHVYLVSKDFHHSKSPYPLNTCSVTPCPAPGSLQSVSKDLLIWDISCQWNHTVSDLLCLASFRGHNVFEVHPCCSTYQYFIPFLCLSNIPPHAHTTVLSIHSFVAGHSGCFHLLAVVNSECFREHVCICIC